MLVCTVTELASFVLFIPQAFKRMPFLTIVCFAVGSVTDLFYMFVLAGQSKLTISKLILHTKYIVSHFSEIVI